jgi:hypothetical protein
MTIGISGHPEGLHHRQQRLLNSQRGRAAAVVGVGVGWGWWWCAEGGRERGGARERESVCVSVCRFVFKQCLN